MPTGFKSGFSAFSNSVPTQEITKMNTLLINKRAWAHLQDQYNYLEYVSKAFRDRRSRLVARLTTSRNCSSRCQWCLNIFCGIFSRIKTSLDPFLQCIVSPSTLISQIVEFVKRLMYCKLHCSRIPATRPRQFIIFLISEYIERADLRIRSSIEQA